MTRLALLSTVVLLACGAETDPPLDTPPEPPLSAGKADVADRVKLLGALAFDAPASGRFVEDLQFDAFTFEVRAGATVDLEITRAGTARALDATLFVYGPKRSEGYGTAALATDDDSGWGRHPRLRALTLAEAGTYLVVLGAHDGRGRGAWRLSLRCPTGDCAPPRVEWPATCPADLFEGLRRCAAEQATDPGADPRTRLTPEEALDVCADAEAFAGPFDAHCASAPSPACEQPYEDAWRHLSPLCRDALAPHVRRLTCAFGDTWRGLRHAPRVAITGERTVRQASQLDSLGKRQAVALLKALGHTDVTSASRAIARADDQALHVVDLWDQSHQRAFTGFELGLGDTSVGGIFAHGKTDLVARNSDGDLQACLVAPGPAGRDCREAADCEAGLTCRGQAEVDGVGRCVPARDDHPHEGYPCNLSVPCPTASGLLCAGLSRYPQDGLCLPAWMRETFDGHDPVVLAPGARTLEIPIRVHGLSSVDMDVWFGLELTPDAPTGLTITLVNAATAEVRLFDGHAAHDTLFLDHTVIGFSGDEHVNGDWVLRVTDHGGAGLTLHRWFLTVGSRWD